MANEVGSFLVERDVGIIEIDNPPVNALGIHTRQAMADGLRQFEANPAVRAIVLICGGRTFFAGADISEFGKPQQSPSLLALLDMFEKASKPVVAAIHGTALGGGFETALVCNYRIAVPSAMVGLPEVRLGLLPGAGGTQRLPRIVGPAVALDVIVAGTPLAAPKALELGMIDRLAEEGRLREDAIAFARKAADNGLLPMVRDRNDLLDAAKSDTTMFETYIEQNARVFRGFKAPGHIVRAVQAAVETSPDFEAGMARELELFHELHDSPESAAQRYYFFAERETSKVPDIPRGTPTTPITTVGVIGAGTMGGGITMNFSNAGIPVTLVEMNEVALKRGMTLIRRNYENTAKKGRLTPDQVEMRMGLITPALAIDALAGCDLVIEAVFEDIAIKKDIFSKLDAVCKTGAILSSNTSFLDLDEIAEATGRPGQVVGLHFFSPANVMRLLEVVRGKKTDDGVTATAMALAKRIGKVPVLSRVCHGFIANRIMERRWERADALILGGPSPQQVDQALYDFGFAMGHFQMMDLVGLDVVKREEAGRSVAGELVRVERLGQKRNGGYYDYDDRRRSTPSPVAAALIAEIARERGTAPRGVMSNAEIIADLLYPVVNEGAKLLEEGIAIRASDIDVAAILGYNWPVYTGGPMFWGDTVGLAQVAEGLRATGVEPSALLLEKVARGESFTRS